jgi:hypothetical protein
MSAQARSCRGDRLLLLSSAAVLVLLLLRCLLLRQLLLLCLLLTGGWHCSLRLQSSQARIRLERM